MRTVVGAGLGGIAGLFGGVLLAIPLAGIVQNQPLFIFAALAAGAALGAGVTRLRRRRRPLIEPAAPAVEVHRPLATVEPEIIPGRTVVIGEGVALSGVLWCERLIVRGRFSGTIHVGPSWENELKVAGGEVGPTSSLA